MQSQVEFQKRLTFVHLTVMGVSPSAVQTSLIWGSLMAALILLVSALILGGTLTVTLTMVWSGWPTPLLTWQRYWPPWLAWACRIVKSPLGLRRNPAASWLVLKISTKFPPPLPDRSASERQKCHPSICLLKGFPLPISFFHVILGVGAPSALQGNSTFCPSVTSWLEGFSSQDGGTVENTLLTICLAFKTHHLLHQIGPFGLVSTT